MAHKTSDIGTTAPSPSGAVAPAARTRAVTFGRPDAATGLGHVPVAAEDVDDDGTCNCSRYQTCDYCTMESYIERVELAKEYDADDDAFMDSFYRTLGGRGGCE